MDTRAQMWMDCRKAGRDHELVLIQTTQWANYYSCGMCPLVFRKSADRRYIGR